MPDTSLRHSRRVQRQSGKREWDTAYHEAGHAVAAFFLGMSIGRNGVTIVPDKIKQSLGTGHILSQLRERPDVSVSPLDPNSAPTHVYSARALAVCYLLIVQVEADQLREQRDPNY